MSTLLSTESTHHRHMVVSGCCRGGHQHISGLLPLLRFPLGGRRGAAVGQPRSAPSPHPRPLHSARFQLAEKSCLRSCRPVHSAGPQDRSPDGGRAAPACPLRLPGSVRSEADVSLVMRRLVGCHPALLTPCGGDLVVVTRWRGAGAAQVTKYTKDGPGTPGGSSWTPEWLKFDNSYFSEVRPSLSPFYLVRTRARMAGGGGGGYVS